MHARFGGNIFSKVLIKQNNLENVNEITDLKSFPVFENVTFFKESNVINVENPSFSSVGLCMVHDHTYSNLRPSTNRKHFRAFVYV
jgi:hypothetical protein